MPDESGRILHTVELSGRQWLICIAGGLVIAVASEVRKLLLRRRLTATAPSDAGATSAPPVAVGDA
jgi:hypothetical protein